jgi:UPF0755 protein
VNQGDDRDIQSDVAQSLASMAANDDLQPTTRPRSPAEALEPARAPEPPKRRDRRRMHPFFAFLNGMMTMIIIAFLGLGGLLYYAKTQFDQPGPLDHSTVVVIPKGEGVNAIAARLEREGVVSDRRLFVASVIYFKAQDRLRYGEYSVEKNMSMREVLDTLVEGRAILHKVTIPEGYTSWQVVERLNGHETLTGELAVLPAEGSLLPDTYRFSRGSTRKEIIERMQAEQQKFVAKLWESRAQGLPFKTPMDAIILASIVEKETGRSDERDRVAAVFVNRMKKGMRLDSDPTIIYGVSGGKGSLGRPILRSELDRPTPYNTYKIKGLPPTPIANPGRASIEAVLRPAQTNDLFFVADGSGGHVFTGSLAEHNKNVAKWRIVERQIRAKEAAARAASEASSEQVAGMPGGVITPVPNTTGPPEGSTIGNLAIPSDTTLLAPDSIGLGSTPSRASARKSASVLSVPLPTRNPRLR